MRNAIIFSLLARLAASQTIEEVISNNEELSTLGTVLGLVPEVVETLAGLTDVTIFAPNAAALGPLLENPTDVLPQVANILAYHVVTSGAFTASNFTSTAAFEPTLLTDPEVTAVTGGQVVKIVAEGDGVKVNTANVVTADLAFVGGVIHVIDEVLTIPGTVVEALTEAGLTSLAEAATNADLVDTLSTTADLTIFAPTNEAFEAIADVVAGLTTEELSAILQYHVIAGTVGYSTSLSDGASLETVQGRDVTISISDDGVMVNDAMVTTADVLVSNGVVHVINGVLIPPENGDGNGDDTGDQPDPTEGPEATVTPTTVNNAPSIMPSTFVTLVASLLTFAMVMSSL